MPESGLDKGYSWPPFAGPLRGSARWLMLACCWCVLPVSGAQESAASAASAITAITLERDCAGCASGSVLVLLRDGAASCTWTGHARFGTQDRKATGSVRAQDFDGLAQAVLAHGFFGLDEHYEDPQLQDGAWFAITVVRDGQGKRVFSRNEAGPPSLRALEVAVESVQARLHFVPACR